MTIATILGAEGDDTLFDLLFSRPAGIALSIMYTIHATAIGADGLPSVPTDIVSLAVNYGIPFALVVYFLIRDDRREKRNIAEDAKRRKSDQEKDEARRKEDQIKEAAIMADAHKREERMAKRIDELENYINDQMMKGLESSSKAVDRLAAQIEGLLSATKDNGRKG